MSPARGRWQKCEGSVPRRGLSGAASGGLRGAGERCSFLPTVPSSLPLSRVSARVPATACLESPRLSRGRCGGMRGAERGGCRGVGRAVPAFFFALLHFSPEGNQGARNWRYFFRAASCYGCAFARGREHAWDRAATTGLRAPSKHHFPGIPRPGRAEGRSRLGPVRWRGWRLCPGHSSDVRPGRWVVVAQRRAR